MLERRKKENQVRCWIEGEKENLLLRAYAVENPFVAAFYAQCAESTAADAHEVFLETPLAFNYFRENLDRLDMEGITRFFKLAAIHHTIRIVRRRKKELDWAEMKGAMTEIYQLDERERELAELLHRCAVVYQSGFNELFHKVTARYLFGDRELSGFSFAFIGNFWYNSYSSFMGSFTGYVPFHIRLRDAL
ncbi:MAG: hypothetical protein IJY52_00480 [Anaerotignum sp.]|nr:hypothetical protein [Anaerotignum sp.]